MKARRWLAVVATSGSLLAAGVGFSAVVATSAGAEAAIPGVEAAAGSQAAHPLRDTLNGLVSDGTLTQAQADKVYDTLVTRAKEGRTQRAEARRQWAEKVGGVVGVGPDELASDLKAGQTLAQIGQAHGKTRQQVIDGLVGLIKSELDQQVSNGRLTQAQEDKILSKASGRIGTAVDKPMPHLGDGHRWLRLLHRHQAANGGSTGGSAPTSSTSPSSTTSS